MLPANLCFYSNLYSNCYVIAPRSQGQQTLQSLQNRKGTSHYMPLLQITPIVETEKTHPTACYNYELLRWWRLQVPSCMLAIQHHPNRCQTYRSVRFAGAGVAPTPPAEQAPAELYLHARHHVRQACSETKTLISPVRMSMRTAVGRGAQSRIAEHPLHSRLQRHCDANCLTPPM